MLQYNCPATAVVTLIGESLTETTHAMTSTSHCGSMMTRSRRKALVKCCKAPSSCKNCTACTVYKQIKVHVGTELPAPATSKSEFVQELPRLHCLQANQSSYRNCTACIIYKQIRVHTGTAPLASSTSKSEFL